MRIPDGQTWWWDLSIPHFSNSFRMFHVFVFVFAFENVFLFLYLMWCPCYCDRISDTKTDHCVFLPILGENKRKTDFDQNNIKHCQILPNIATHVEYCQYRTNIAKHVKHCQSDIKTFLPGEISPLVVIILSNINNQQCNCAGLEVGGRGFAF